MFSSHWSSTSRDIKYLISHTTSQNQVFEQLSGVVVGNPFMVSYHFAKFGGHRHCGSGDVFDFSCDLTSQRD